MYTCGQPMIAASRLQGLGAGADDFNRKTAQGLTDFCENFKWYDWINPVAWAACFAGDATNVYQLAKGDWGQPVVTSPNMRPPAAPQTEDKMRTWTPADIEEARAQQRAQWERDMAAIRAGNGQLGVDYDEEGRPRPGFDWTPFIIVGAVAIIAYMAGRE